MAKKKGQLQGRPAPAPASKAPLAFTQWGLPQASPPAAAPPQSRTPGAATSGPAPGASKKKGAQAGSFPPFPSKAQQQVRALYEQTEEELKANTTGLHGGMGAVFHEPRTDYHQPPIKPPSNPHPTPIQSLSSPQLWHCLHWWAVSACLSLCAGL